MKTRYKLDVNVIRSDGEMNRNKTKKWLRSQGITLELSAPRTQEQNGVTAASRSLNIYLANDYYFSFARSTVTVRSGLSSSVPPTTFPQLSIVLDQTSKLVMPNAKRQRRTPTP